MTLLQEQSLIKKCYYLLYLFMAGFLLGIILVNLGRSVWIREDGLLNVQMLHRMKDSLPDAAGLFAYIVKSRISVLGILLILSTTMLGLAAVCGYILYCGISAGCILTVAAIRYGLWGIAFAAAGVFPQGLLLVPAYLMLLCCALDCNRTLYARGETYGRIAGTTPAFWIRKLCQVLVILLFVLLGCAAESYINPGMLRFVLELIC